jgi:hypothetical protein
MIYKVALAYCKLAVTDNRKIDSLEDCTVDELKHAVVLIELANSTSLFDKEIFNLDLDALNYLKDLIVTKKQQQQIQEMDWLI